MGQDNSTTNLADENTPTQTLDNRSVAAVAKFIKDGRARKIVVMTGAGISTSAGIPDFRSPDTGLYANLARLNLPYAEAVFDISYFRNNPLPFYTLAQELYPGKYRPTITHSFITLLHKKGLLLKLFTQNIDCLEREGGVPGDKIVEAHGSFARQSCIECKSSYPQDLMQKAIREKTVPTCVNATCGGLVKPEIVFFGEQLPSDFFNNIDLPADADLCIVMGTSLSVQPFASLPQSCTHSTPRLLINQEQVGGLGSRTDDVLLLGDCDTGVKKLAEALGWLEELEDLWATTAPAGMSDRKAHEEKSKKTRDEELQDEVDQITREVEENLKLGAEQHTWLENHVDNNFAKIHEDDNSKPAAEESAAAEAPKETTLQPVSSFSYHVEKLESRDSDGPGLAHVFPWLK